MKFQKIAAAAALAVSAFGAQAAGNLVVNGSFEANAQGHGTWTIYSNLTGWTGGVGGIELRNYVSGTAQDGVNFVELDSNRNSTMQQTLNFANAGTYELSFWYQARPDNGTRNSNTATLGWSFAGDNGLVLENWTAAGATTWQKFTRTFTIQAAGTQTLSFQALGNSDTYGGSLDNITVTAVPEPETYALLLAGLGVVGAVARRRKHA